MSAIETLRAALYGNPPTAGFKPQREGVLAAIMEIYNVAISSAVDFAAYPTVAAMNAVTNKPVGTLAYVYYNNNSTSDAANKFYQWNGSAWIVANWFFNQIASMVSNNSYLVPVSATGTATNMFLTPSVALPNNTGYNIVFFIQMAYDKPDDIGISVRIDGINPSSALTLADTDGNTSIANGRWKAGDFVMFTRDPVSGIYRLVSVARQGSSASAGASRFVWSSVAGTDTNMLLTPLSPLPNNTGADTLFAVRFPFDRPNTFEVLIRVDGINAGDPFQLRAANGVDQVGSYSNGDIGFITKQADKTYYELSFIDSQSGSGGGMSAYQAIQARRTAMSSAEASRRARLAGI